jgi:outer membrane protein OmpA-like peptidoglycan-associated protein
MSAIRTAVLLPLAVCTVLALGPAAALAEGDAPAPAAGVPAAPAAPPSCLGKARLRGELFEEDDAALKPEVLPLLDVVADALKGPCAGKRILIEGHTEDSGDVAADQSISEKRAEEVKGALVARGVPAARLDTKGFGSSRPLTTDPALEELNRRVTFVVEGE